MQNDPERESFASKKIARTNPMTVLKKWSMLKTHLEGGRAAIVGLHQQKPNVDWSTIEIAKEKLLLQSSLPDPYLLVVKAAFNFLVYDGTNLMPPHPEVELGGLLSSGEINSIQDQGSSYQCNY
jgi:hypothetical protein